MTGSDLEAYAELNLGKSAVVVPKAGDTLHQMIDNGFSDRMSGLDAEQLDELEQMVGETT